MEPKTFFLSSMDSVTFSHSRECVFVKELRFSSGKECVLVKVDPPVLGQQYGLGSEDMEFLILSARHEGESLVPIRGFPVFVYICRVLLQELAEGQCVSKDDLEVIAWGEVYRTREEAEEHSVQTENGNGAAH